MLLAIGERTLDGYGALGAPYADHLLVWALRRIVTGRGGCVLLSREFAEACGEDGPEVLAAFGAFLNVLAWGGRRSLAIRPPGALAFSADERRVLALVAAAQGGDQGRFALHLDWLARREARETVAVVARAVAAAFSAHALTLTAPGAVRTPPI
jgi:hypothetical protein